MISFIINKWDDILVNITASVIFYPIELIITILIVNSIINYRENKRWRPARLNVARQIHLCHRTIINATQYIVDPNLKTDLKSHGFPPDFTQDQANYWTKNIFLRHVEPTITRLNKLVEFNNSALDSFSLPLASDFLIAAEAISGNLKNITESYNPNNKITAGLFYPREFLEKMYFAHEKLLKHFPEILDIKDGGPTTILNMDEIINLYLAAEKSGNIELIHRK